MPLKTADLIIALNKSFPFQKEDYDCVIKEIFNNFKMVGSHIQFRDKIDVTKGGLFTKKTIHFAPAVVSTIFSSNVVRQELEFMINDDAHEFFGYLVQSNGYRFKNSSQKDWENAYEESTKTSVHLVGRRVICYKFLKAFEYIQEEPSMYPDDY